MDKLTYRKTALLAAVRDLFRDEIAALAWLERSVPAFGGLTPLAYAEIHGVEVTAAHLREGIERSGWVTA